MKKTLIIAGLSVPFCLTLFVFGAFGAFGSADLVAKADSAAEPIEPRDAVSLAGQGAPPDGTYKCMNPASASSVGLGSLEIQGKTYRGLVAEGDFNPYTVDPAGNITWTAGLKGLDEGWTVGNSEYSGTDNKGRPAITIRFSTKAGTSEVIVAVKE